MMNPTLAVSPNLSGTTHVEHLASAPPNLPADSLLRYSTADVTFVVRSVGAVYLNGLRGAPNSSSGDDPAGPSTSTSTALLLSSSVELLKFFGLKVFIAGVGDRLQDWIRLLLLHSGSHNVTVRVAALELMALLLRACWNSFGSLTKIRVPCLAVFVEVAEKKAGERGAEDAARTLAPLLKSLDRMETSSASKNLAFKER